MTRYFAGGHLRFIDGSWRDDKGDVVNVEKVVYCVNCKHSKPIDTSKPPYKHFRPECIMCYCEDVVGDEPMVYSPTHFCSFGKEK
jgi:hypothetical protein